MDLRRLLRREKSGMRKRLIIGFATLFILIVVIVFLLRPDRRTVKREDSARVSELPGGAEEKIDAELFSDMLSYRFKVRKMYSYGFNRRAAATLKGEAILDVELGGRLDVHAIESSGATIDLIVTASFEKVHGVEMNSAGPSGQSRINSAWVRLRRDGTVESLQFPREMGKKEEQQVFKDVIANFFQVLPNMQSPELPTEKEGIVDRVFGAGRAYGIESSDTHGEYTALVRILERDRSPAFLKQVKTRYVRSPAPVRIDESDRTMAHNVKDGIPLLVASHEKLTVGPEGFSASTDQSARFEFQGVQDSAYGKGDLAFYTISGEIYDEAVYVVEKGGVPLKRPVRPFDELATDLQSMSDQTPNEKKHEIFLDLTTAARAKPEIAKDLATEARRYNSKSDAFQMITGALSFAGHPEAQSALTGLFKDGGLDPFGRQSILESFILMERPLTPSSRAFLRDLFGNTSSEELRAGAGLALGSSLRNAPDEDVRSLLEKQWRSASGIEAQMSVLEYIGNSGDTSFFGIIKEAMDNPSLLIQRKAVYATRFMESDEVSDYVLGILRRHSDDRVREKAAESMSMHRWSDRYYDILARCVESDSSTPVRIKCADYVLSQQNRAAEMRALLSRVNTSDSDMKEFVQRSQTD